MNVLIPMAGLGTRVGGGNLPKPLVEVFGQPMIRLVVAALGLENRYVFVVREEDDYRFNFDDVLRRFVDDFEVVRVPGLTEGAACTALQASPLVDNDEPLLLAVCDVVNDLGSNWQTRCLNRGTDGIVFCFESDSPAYSYVRTDESGLVEEVAEKRVISNLATTGNYFWRRGSDFVRYTKRMVDENYRVNNEFYLAPAFNFAAKDGRRIGIEIAGDFNDLGTDAGISLYSARAL